MNVLGRNLGLLLSVSLVSTILVPSASAAKLDLFRSARCQAFCITKFPGSNAENQQKSLICHTADCRSCIEPCSQEFNSLQSCISTCTSVSCESSCKFLNSTPSSYEERIAAPGKPVVKGKNFSSVALSWSPPDNTSDETAVYVIQMVYGGDLSSRTWITLDKVFHTPKAVVSDVFLCRRVRWFFETNFGPRDTYNGIYYKFRVVAVTQNSAQATGDSTDKIWLPRPNEAREVTFSLVRYGPQGSGLDELQFNGNWAAPVEHVGEVSRYFVTWKGSNCFKIPRRNIRRYSTTNKFIKLYLAYDQLRGCKNEFKVFALAGCSVSHAATFIVVNPGCRNIANFPKDKCCKVDPPKAASSEDLKVRNLRRGPFHVSDDFRFSFNVTWDAPRYLETTGCDVLLNSYSYRYGDPNVITPCTSFFICPPIRWGKIAFTVKRHAYFQGIETGSLFKIRVVPNLRGPEQGVARQLNFTVLPSEEERKVRYLDVKWFRTWLGTRLLRVRWSKPLFDSGLSHYQYSYVLGKSQRIIKKTNKTYFALNLRGDLHSFSLEVLPVYSHPKIHGIESKLTLKVPDGIHCAVRRDGFYAHPFVCSKFVLCHHGVKRVVSCRAGTYYNPRRGRNGKCQPAWKVDCRFRGGYNTKDKAIAVI